MCHFRLLSCRFGSRIEEPSAESMRVNITNHLEAVAARPVSVEAVSYPPV